MHYEIGKSCFWQKSEIYSCNFVNPAFLVTNNNIILGKSCTKSRGVVDI